MITLTPRPCQTLMTMMDGIDQKGSLIHFCGGMPNTPRNSLSSPPWGL